MAYGESAAARPAPRSGVVRAANRAASGVAVSVSATAPIVRRFVVLPATGSNARTPLIAVDLDTFAGYEVDDFDGLGFSFGKIVSNIGKAVSKAAKDTKNAVVKGAVDTAHVTGKAVTSTAGKAIIGGALALTGVGLPAAVAIGAATQATGQLIKPGGNLGKAASGAVEGGAEGAAAGLVGKVLKNNAGNLVDAARSKIGLGSFRPQAKTAVIGPVDAAPDGPPVSRGTPLKFSKVPDLTHLPTPPAPPVIVGPGVPPALSPAGLVPITTGGADPVLSAGKSVVKRASSAVGKAKQAVSDNSDVLNAIQSLAQSQQPPTIFPGGGQVPSPSGSGDTPAPAPQQASILGNVPPIALAAAAGLALLLVMRKR